MPRKPDQASLATRTATGAETGAAADVREQQAEYLTTAQGARLYDTDHSLKAAERGPTLLQDHHLREKITHFDHERIPRNGWCARGAAAHGVFVGYGTAAQVCKAGFLAEGVTTPVFTRFSTVVGSRGSADTVRDTRGFATKFYTGEGTFDLVPTTSRCSSSRTASSSRTSSTPSSRTRTGRSRRRTARTTRSGTSCPCTPRPPTTSCGTCSTGACRAPTG